MIAACSAPKTDAVAEADITKAAKALEKAADAEVDRAIADLERESAARRAAQPDANPQPQPTNETGG